MGRYFSKKAVKARFREPSTWAGLAVLASVFGSAVGIPPGVSEWVVGAAAVAAGVLPEAPGSDA
jgi:hypothetical protein